MAVIKWSALTTGAKGKLHGSVLQFSAGGQIVRANRRSNQFSNPRWSHAKVNVATNANNYRSLTSAERTSFTSLTTSYPTKDRFGNTRYPSTYELFMRLNNSLLYSGMGQLTTCVPPVTFSYILPATLTSLGGTYLHLNLTSNWAADEILLVTCSPPMSIGRSIPKGKYVLIGRFTNSTGLTIDLTSYYEATFGFQNYPQTIYCKCTLMNINNGQQSAPFVMQLLN